MSALRGKADTKRLVRGRVSEHEPIDRWAVLSGSSKAGALIEPATHDACYEENGDGGRTSDLSTSVSNFFFSFFASLFTLLISFFGLFNSLSFLAIVSSRAVAGGPPAA